MYVCIYTTVTVYIPIISLSLSLYVYVRVYRFRLPDLIPMIQQGVEDIIQVKNTHTHTWDVLGYNHG